MVGSVPAFNIASCDNSYMRLSLILLQLLLSALSVEIEGVSQQEVYIAVPSCGPICSTMLTVKIPKSHQQAANKRPSTISRKPYNISFKLQLPFHLTSVDRSSDISIQAIC